MCPPTPSRSARTPPRLSARPSMTGQHATAPIPRSARRQTPSRRTVRPTSRAVPTGRRALAGLPPAHPRPNHRVLSPSGAISAATPVVYLWLGVADAALGFDAAVGVFETTAAGLLGTAPSRMS